MLGHTRLSIIDLSKEADQPFEDELGNLLVFNGEIYNFWELRSGLEALGHAFRTRSDSEVLLHAFREWGPACLTRLRGMFAFAHYNPRRRELHLVRDRWGVKPLSFFQQGNQLAFASTADALRPLMPQANLDAEAVYLYLGLGWVPAPWSIYREVRKVLPGQWLRFRWDEAGNLQSHGELYWSIAEIPPASHRDSSSWPDDQFEGRLRTAVTSRHVADVPVGILLSGGIDSTLVAAISQEARGDFSTFTLGFEEAAFDEAPYAEAIARQLGTQQHTLRIPAESVELAVADAWKVFDEPFADSSSVPMLALCREVVKHVKVALSGDGQDEVHGGYPWHHAFQRVRNWSWLPRAARQALAWGAGRYSTAARYQSAVLAQADWAAQWSTLRCGIPPEASHQLPVEGVSQFATLDQYFREWAKPLAGVDQPLDWACRMDLVTYLPDDLLVKADRTSMSCGLELREPLLDKDLTAWGLQLPVSRRYDFVHHKSKLLARRALARRMPPDLFERPKSGFVPPVRQWLKGKLQPLARQTLDRLRAGKLPPLHWPRGAATWEDFSRALNDHHDVFLWRLLCYAGWYDQHHDR